MRKKEKAPPVIGRPPGKWYPDVMQARLPKGTFARIAALLEEGEDRTDLVRLAVKRELWRREKALERAKNRLSDAT